MTIHLGNVPAGTTLYIPFATYDKTNGASVTMTGLAVTDIEIYKDGSTTQRASDAGYALLDTDGIDFDSLTGIHGFSIDLSDNTDSGFYAVGSFYWVVVSSITVDSQTVNFIPATFRIVAAENTAGYPIADAAKIGGTTQTGRDIGASVLLSSGTGTGQVTLSSGVVSANAVQISGDSTAADNAEAFFDGTGYAGTNNVIPTVTTLTGHTAQTGDSYARLGAPAGASVSADIAAVKSDTGAILTDTGTTLDALIKDVPTVAEFEARTLAAADYVVVTDTIAGVTTVGSVTGAVGSVTGAVGSVTAGVTLADDAITAAKFDESTAFPLTSADTGATAVARTGADADTLETLSDQLDAAALEATAQDILTDTAEIGVAGAGLTAIDLPNQTMDITGNITGNLSGSVGSVTAEVTANVTKISGDATAADRLEAVLDAMPSGVVVDDNDPDPTTTAFETNLSEATDDHYNGAFVVFTSGALLGQSRKISDYDGTTKVVTVAVAFTEAPSADDTFIILGRSE